MELIDGGGGEEDGDEKNPEMETPLYLNTNVLIGTESSSS